MKDKKFIIILHLLFKNNMNCILLRIFLLLCCTQLINCLTCSCSCCTGQSCQVTYQGSFPLDSCTNYKCMIQCRVKFANCPPDGTSGDTQGKCTSDPAGYAIQHKANLILIFFSFFIMKFYI
ncbi:hypothetical protein I4U23_006113 [Adineta vaga]|nr:hypothetical protein I4U23_006113 [Adineta vaga]